MYSGGGVCTSTRQALTLFVTNIPGDCTFEQILQLFGNDKGLCGIRPVGSVRRRMVFVDYDSLQHSTAAMRQHQGHTFKAGEEGLMIDYDKDARSKRTRALGRTWKGSSFGTGGREASKAGQAGSSGLFGKDWGSGTCRGSSKTPRLRNGRKNWRLIEKDMFRGEQRKAKADLQAKERQELLKGPTARPDPSGIAKRARLAATLQVKRKADSDDAPHPENVLPEGCGDRIKGLIGYESDEEDVVADDPQKEVELAPWPARDSDSDNDEGHESEEEQEDDESESAAEDQPV